MIDLRPPRRREGGREREASLLPSFPPSRINFPLRCPRSRNHNFQTAPPLAPSSAISKSRAWTRTASLAWSVLRLDSVWRVQCFLPSPFWGRLLAWIKSRYAAKWAPSLRGSSHSFRLLLIFTGGRPPGLWAARSRTQK